MISETKLDLSFLNGQFQIHGYYETYRFDKNGNGGKIFAFFRKDIPAKIIESQMKIKGIFIELTLRRNIGFCAALIILNILKDHII